MSEPASAALESWISREYPHAAGQMLRSVSAVDVTQARPGFGQLIHPAKGSIVASPVPASYDPDPDYFFHWYRDSAAVMEALRVLAGDGRDPETMTGRFADFVSFSLGLCELDGRTLVADPAWRAAVHTDFVRYLRTNADLGRVHGATVAAETRVNADGTLDISSWARPQHDGPALRALTVVRWMRGAALDSRDDSPHARTAAPDPRSAALNPRIAALDPGTAAAAAALLRADLAFTRARWREPCFDIWEEELGTHYYALCVAAAALDEGAAWLDERGETAEARTCRADAAVIRDRLDGFWLADEGFYQSRALASGERSAKALDISVVLAANHANAAGPRHSVRDPRVLATLARLEALFDAEYPLNRRRTASRGPALGRYRGDVYYSGGAYYFSTLGAAELCFRAAAAAADPAARRALGARGDAYLETVRAFTPPSGDLSEQFDQRTGEQTSAKHLAWSYAAFITCIAARRAVS